MSERVARRSASDGHAVGSLDTLNHDTEQVPLDPGTGRPAGRAQALVLLFASCMPVLGAVLIAPVLPKIQEAFAGTPGVEALTPIVLTVPALVIGLAGALVGRVVDRVGRKGLLVWSLVVYALVGTAPLWLPSLQAILISRVLVGFAEAAIMTCCTTLIGDYFHGRQRIRYLGLQTVFTSVSATIFFGVGGALGSSGWRTPFWVYAISLPLAAVAARVIWQPQRPQRSAAERLATVDWGKLALPVGASFVGGAVFYVLVVELSFVLDGLGVTSTGTIGAISALGSAAVAAAAFVFPRIAHRGSSFTVPLSLVVTAVGLALLGTAGSVPLVVLAAVVTGAGNGLLLPSMLTWAVSGLAFEERGRGTGAWTAAVFLGQFVCPLVVLAFKAGLGSLGAAVVAMSLISLALAALVRVRIARS